MQYHLLFGHRWRISWNLLYDPTECAQLYHDHDWQPTTKPDKNFKKETNRLLQTSESIQSIKSIQVFFFPVKWKKKKKHKHDSFNTKTLLKLWSVLHLDFFKRLPLLNQQVLFFLDGHCQPRSTSNKCWNQKKITEVLAQKSLWAEAISVSNF